MKYIYPKLPGVKTFPFFRIGGNGLANCLFVYAKAIVLAEKFGAKVIKPTWFNLSLGTYMRHQADKRHYLGLFKGDGEIRHVKRLLLLLMAAKTNNVSAFERQKNGILVVDGIYDFFKPLMGHHELILQYLTKQIPTQLLHNVDKFDFCNCVAVHVRLGDFPEDRRVPMAWYLRMIEKHSCNRKILLFSDGTDEELQQLTSIPNVQRVYFGGAIQDIIALSRCAYLIGSDSSFSAWGAYLGQVPCTFYRLQYGRILEDESLQYIENK